MRTFAEQDIASFGSVIAPAAMLRFWTMLAHYHGQTWNAAEVASSLGIGASTVRRYLDLLMLKNGRRFGIECKRADAPKLTPSMHIAMSDLRLDSLTVLYPGTKSYPLAENIRVEPLAGLAG